MEDLISSSSSIGGSSFDGDDKVSLSMTKGLRNYGFRYLLFLLIFNSSKGFLFVRLPNFGIEIVSLGKLFSRFLPGPGSASRGARGTGGSGEILEVVSV
jgi:hypothetical protein